jgi:hypothetical protein
LQTLPRWGMTVDGLLWEQPTCGSPTPKRQNMDCAQQREFLSYPQQQEWMGGATVAKPYARGWTANPNSGMRGGKAVEQSGEDPIRGLHTQELNKPHMTYGAKLSDAVLYEQKKKFPTPQASDHRDRGK